MGLRRARARSAGGALFWRPFSRRSSEALRYVKPAERGAQAGADFLGPFCTKYSHRRTGTPCKWCQKAPKFPALGAGRPITRFPHTYSIWINSLLFSKLELMNYSKMYERPALNM